MIHRIGDATIRPVISGLARWLVLLLVLALVWVVLGAARSSLDAGDGLVAEYFANVNWNGRPAFSVADTEPSAGTMRRRWNDNPPERFSVRWTGFLTAVQSGLYTFVTAFPWDDKRRDGDGWSKVKHFFVLMLEYHSFDCMLGCRRYAGEPSNMNSNGTRMYQSFDIWFVGMLNRKSSPG